MEALLTAEQAGEILQIHPKTVKRMAAEGIIPGMKIGKLWRFRESSLDSWIQSHLLSNGHLCPAVLEEL
jgi:excisionase family DNA binding protein